MSYERTDRAEQKRSRTIRWGVLGGVLIAITAIATAHQYVNGAGKPVPVDAVCPFGGIETLWSVISGAGFIDKTAASAVVLLVGMLAMALVMRRSFCGQICPLGTLQGLFGSIGGKFFRKRPEIPRPVDRVARFLKYGILAFFTVWTWQAASLVMRPYDPWVAYAHITSSELLTSLGAGLAVLGVSLAGSLVYERFFCKYLCPTGAVLGLLSKISIFGIKRDENVCTNCGACDKACPMNIEVSTSHIVDSSECISCNECVNVCPAAGALEIKLAGAAKVKPALTTGVVVALIGVMIGTSTIAGVFAWTMPSLGQAIEQQREGGAVTAGKAFDTTLIKGYMSMKEVSKASGIAEEEFVQKCMQWNAAALEEEGDRGQVRIRARRSQDLGCREGRQVASRDERDSPAAVRRP